MTQELESITLFCKQTEQEFSEILLASYRPTKNILFTSVPLCLEDVLCVLVSDVFLRLLPWCFEGGTMSRCVLDDLSPLRRFLVSASPHLVPATNSGFQCHASYSAVCESFFTSADSGTGTSDFGVSWPLFAFGLHRFFMLPLKFCRA